MKNTQIVPDIGKKNIGVKIKLTSFLQAHWDLGEFGHLFNTELSDTNITNS